MFSYDEDFEDQYVNNYRHEIQTPRYYMTYESIYGRRLKPGETIEADDVYESTSGTWEKAPCPGVKIQEGTKTIWIRPVKAT